MYMDGCMHVCLKHMICILQQVHTTTQDKYLVMNLDASEAD